MGIPAGLVYILCTVTSGLCTWLLYRAYCRAPLRVLLWSALCFLLLTLNNAVVFLDLVLLPEGDLSLERLAIALLAVSVLLFGFVWDM